MLTIKANQVSGVEDVMQTRHVTCQQDTDGHTSDSRVVFWDDEQGQEWRLRTGDIYVMNDAGKTVADYHLGSDMPIQMGETESK